MMVGTELFRPFRSFRGSTLLRTRGEVIDNKGKNKEVIEEAGNPGKAGNPGRNPISQIVSLFDYQDSPALSSPAPEPSQLEPINDSDEHDGEREIIEQSKYSCTLIRLITAPANHAVGMIGPPSPMLLVRGPSLSPTYCRSSEIPAEANECMHIAEWFPIQDHWRGGGR